MKPSYVLVTPVKDEASFIGATIRAVASQTIRPIEWVIVSDGSTDGTESIVADAARSHPWIRLVALPSRSGRDFAAVVENIHLGVRALNTTDYEYLGLLDGDVDLASNYYETLIGRMRGSPRLGLCGGVVVDKGEARHRAPLNRQDVPGAVQFFTRQCFESIGELIAIPEGGWDCLTCVVARMRGFDTQLYLDLVVDHLKPRSAFAGGALQRRWLAGERDYALGYPAEFEFMKCIARVAEAPMLIGALATWLGFCAALLSRRRRTVPAEVLRYLRSERRARFLSCPNPLGTIRGSRGPQ